MFLEELNIQPAINIRAALRLSPAVCLAAFPLSLAGLNVQSTASVVAWAVLLALFGLALALMRLALGRTVRLLGVMEILTVTGLLLFIVYFGWFALLDAYRAQSRASATLGVLLTSAGAFGIYRFMYPRRPDPTPQLTVKQLLHGGSRLGPQRRFSSGLFWLVALCACDAALVTGATVLREHWVAVDGAILASILLAHSIWPALGFCMSADGFRILRDLRSAKTRRRQGP